MSVNRWLLAVALLFGCGVVAFGVSRIGGAADTKPAARTSISTAATAQSSGQRPVTAGGQRRSPGKSGSVPALPTASTAKPSREQVQQTQKRRAKVVLEYAVKRQSRPTPNREPQATTLATNSPKASSVPGIMRPCDKARDFVVYTLGERFAGMYASRLGAYCQKPPPVVDGHVASPVRFNSTEVFYGPCRGGGSAGCGHDLSIRSVPSCEEPYALYTTFTGPPSEPVDAPKLIRLRGVPAAVFEDRIELWTRETKISIVAVDPQVARNAVEALQSTSGTVAAGSSALPAPADGIVGTNLSAVRCPA